MYRILLATSGFYYVQQHSAWNGWSKTGGFFPTKASARRFIRRMQGFYDAATPRNGRVVEYVS